MYLQRPRSRNDGDFDEKKKRRKKSQLTVSGPNRKRPPRGLHAILSESPPSESVAAGRKKRRRDPVLCLLVLPDGRLVSTSRRRIQIWQITPDRKGGEVVGEFSAHEHDVRKLVFLADEGLIASLDESGMVYLWDPVTLIPTLSIQTDCDDGDLCFSMSSSCRFLLVGGNFESPQRHQIVGFEQKIGCDGSSDFQRHFNCALLGHTIAISSITALPDGLIASCSLAELCLWPQLRPGTTTRLCTLQDKSPSALTYAANAFALIVGSGSGGGGGGVTQWNLISPNRAYREMEHADHVSCVIDCQDSRVASGGNKHGLIKLWDLRSAHLAQKLQVPGEYVLSFALLPSESGNALVTGHGGGKISVWI